VCTAYMRINHIAGIHSSHRAPVIRQYDLLSALTQHSTDWFLTILRPRDEIFNAGSEGHLSCAASVMNTPRWEVSSCKTIGPWNQIHVACGWS
jgi:hypothetical protein